MSIGYYCLGNNFSRPEVDKLWLQAKCGLPPAFIKFYWHTFMPIHSHFVYGHFYATMADSCNREFVPQSFKHLLSALYRKVCWPSSRQQFTGKCLHPVPGSAFLFLFLFVFLRALLIRVHLPTIYMSASNLVCFSGISPYFCS